MRTFLKWQQKEIWLEMGNSSLIKMASPATSPAVEAARRLCSLMQTGAYTEGSITYQQLLEGRLTSHLQFTPKQVDS